MKSLFKTKATGLPAVPSAAPLGSRSRARARALTGWITLANGLGLLVLFFSGPAAHAQNAYPRGNIQPALQAASPQAQVPTASYQSALTGLPQGVETQSTDWRSANDAVGQFKRGHIDLLKLENASPAQPSAQPAQARQPAQPRSQP